MTYKFAESALQLQLGQLQGGYAAHQHSGDVAGLLQQLPQTAGQHGEVRVAIRTFDVFGVELGEHGVPVLFKGADKEGVRALGRHERVGSGESGRG